MARIQLKDYNKLIGRSSGLTPADSFLHEVTAYVENINLKSHKISQSFKPSSMQCDRNMFYQLRGSIVTTEMMEDNHDFSSIRMGECGTDSHLRIQSYLIDMSKKRKNDTPEKWEYSEWEYFDVKKYIALAHLEDELEVIEKKGLEYKILDKKYNIHFQTDGILKNRTTSKFYVFEFKTEVEEKFRSRIGVDEKHFPQGICYALCFHIDTGVIFLYEGRDFLGHKAYYLPVTEDMKNNLISTMERVNTYLRLSKLPMKCENLKVCRYCEYHRYCDRDVLGELPQVAKEDIKNDESEGRGPLSFK